MIDDRPRVFSFDEPREDFARKLAKAERESIFRRLRRLAGGRGCAAGGAPAYSSGSSAPPARILEIPSDDGDDESSRLSKLAARFGL